MRLLMMFLVGVVAAPLVGCDSGKGTEGRFRINGGVVYDAQTGLTWQREQSSGRRNFREANAYCESLELGGIAHWRLPTLEELATLIDETRQYPAVDPEVFPGYFAGGAWTTTPGESEFTVHTIALSGDGKIDRETGWGHYGAAMCTKNANPPPVRFVAKKYGVLDETVTDLQTGLMWQREGAASNKNWEMAQSYCENLVHANYSDWLLPTREQLATLLEQTKGWPTIDTLAFPEETGGTYWSSSPGESESRYISIGFLYGKAVEQAGGSWYGKVKCVRRAERSP